MNEKPSSSPNRKQIRKTTKPSARDKQPGSSAIELLFATATLATTVVAMWPWTSTPKLPPAAGE